MRAQAGTDSQMTTENIKQVVRDLYGALNSGHVEAASGFWASDALNHGRAVAHPAVQKFIQDIVSIHERTEIMEIVAERKWVACRLIVSGEARAPALHPDRRQDLQHIRA